MRFLKIEKSAQAGKVNGKLHFLCSDGLEVYHILLEHVIVKFNLYFSAANLHI